MAGTSGSSSSGGTKFEVPGGGGGSSGSSSGDRWYFTQEALEKNSPTRKGGWDTMKELSYRQQTANFIQDMGQRLRVSQLCINTAIVYMHRFYVFHSFTKFVWYQLGTAALFLAAKVEEQPRKLEHVIRASSICRGSKEQIDINSEKKIKIYDGNYSREQVRDYFQDPMWRVYKDQKYQAQAQDLVFNENVLLQTLGFDVAIDHPHTHVVRCCHLVRADKDLAQSSYFLASNSLHLTTMCLQYKPTVVACFCIHLACKWSSWEIPLSNEGKSYTQYVDPNVDTELLNKLTEEFLAIFESCPSRLKEKIMTVGGDGGMHNPAGAIANSPFDLEQKPANEQKREHDRKSGEASSSSHRPPGHEFKPEDPHNRHRPSGSGMSSSQLSQREREYREKKEREKLAAQQHRQSGAGSSANTGNSGSAGSGNSGNVRFPGQSSSSSSSSGHHPPPNYRPTDPNKIKQHSMSRGLPPPGHQSSSSAPRLAEPRDILREAASAPRETPFGIAANQSVSGSREQHQQQQQQKDTPAPPQKSQRDYLLKPNAAADAAAGYERPPMPLFNGDKTARPDAANHRSSSGRPYHHDPAKVSAAKHELARRHQEQQDAAKRQLQQQQQQQLQQQMQPPSHVGTSNNSYLKTPPTSQIKAKSPYTAASVPKVPQPSVPLNKHHHNGSAPTTTSANTAITSAAAPASGGNLPDLQPPHHYQQPQQQQQQMPQAPQQQQLPPPVPKTRSLFSPPTTSPERIVPKKEKLSSPTKPVSPLVRTPPPGGRQRTRNYSSGSEPELRPVMKKIDQVEGFENLMRDSSIGINKLHQIPDIITPIADKIKEETIKPDIEQLPFYKEMRPPDIIKPLSGSCFEPPPLVKVELNNPAVISNLLKDVPVKSQLSLAGPSSAAAPSSEKEKERHHHKSKKKNKEKHKHKDKDKNREEKEKKKKHKEKDRERKHRQQQQQVEQPQQVEPIPKLKIQGDKVQAVVVTSPPATSHEIKPLKIKISTKPSGENGATSVGGSAAPQQQPPATLKIKIPKEKLNSADLLQQQQHQQSRKRDRHQERNSSEAPSAKVAKTSSSKQNGRYHKVTQLGDGDARLAESKYTNKSSSS